MMPIDLSGENNLKKTLQMAYDLDKYYEIPICFASVASSTPGEAAPTPQAHAALLAEFAAEQAERYGIEATSTAPVAHDPATALHSGLLHAIDETGADLVGQGGPTFPVSGNSSSPQMP